MMRQKTTLTNMGMLMFSVLLVITTFAQGIKKTTDSGKQKDKSPDQSKSKAEKPKASPAPVIVVQITNVTVDPNGGLEKPNGRMSWSISAPELQSPPDVKTAEIEIIITRSNGTQATIKQALNPAARGGSFFSALPPNTIATNFSAKLTLLFTVDNRSFRETFQQSGAVSQPSPQNNSGKQK